MKPQTRLVALVMALVLACAQASIASSEQEGGPDDETLTAIRHLNESLERQRSRTRRLSVGLGIVSMAVGAGLVSASAGSSSEGTGMTFESDTRMVLGASGAVALIVGFAVFVGGLKGDPKVVVQSASSSAELPDD